MCGARKTEFGSLTLAHRGFANGISPGMEHGKGWSNPKRTEQPRTDGQSNPGQTDHGSKGQRKDGLCKDGLVQAVKRCSTVAKLGKQWPCTNTFLCKKTYLCKHTQWCKLILVQRQMLVQTVFFPAAESYCSDIVPNPRAALCSTFSAPNAAG